MHFSGAYCTRQQTSPPRSECWIHWIHIGTHYVDRYPHDITQQWWVKYPKGLGENGVTNRPIGHESEICSNKNMGVSLFQGLMIASSRADFHRIFHCKHTILGCPHKLDPWSPSLEGSVVKLRQSLDELSMDHRQLKSQLLNADEAGK